MEAPGSIPLKCGGHDHCVASPGIQGKPERRDQFISIVEPAIPQQEASICEDQWLPLASRLCCGVKGPVQQPERAVEVGVFPIRAVLAQIGACSEEPI